MGSPMPIIFLWSITLEIFWCKLIRFLTCVKRYRYVRRDALIVVLIPYDSLMSKQDICNLMVLLSFIAEANQLAKKILHLFYPFLRPRHSQHLSSLSIHLVILFSTENALSISFKAVNVFICAVSGEMDDVLDCVRLLHMYRNFRWYIYSLVSLPPVILVLLNFSLTKSHKTLEYLSVADLICMYICLSVFVGSQVKGRRAMGTYFVKCCQFHWRLNLLMPL